MKDRTQNKRVKLNSPRSAIWLRTATRDLWTWNCMHVCVWCAWYPSVCLTIGRMSCDGLKTSIKVCKWEKTSRMTKNISNVLPQNKRRYVECNAEMHLHRFNETIFHPVEYLKLEDRLVCCNYAWKGKSNERKGIKNGTSEKKYKTNRMVEACMKCFLNFDVKDKLFRWLSIEKRMYCLTIECFKHVLHL